MIDTSCIEGPPPEICAATSGGDSLDRADMHALAEGHAPALDSLMERHSQKVFHYLLRQTRDELEAQDIAQETFVRIFEHAHKYDPRHKFSTWLYTIATNLLRDRLRYAARHPAVSLEALADPLEERGAVFFPDPKSLPPSQTADQSERALAVQNAIDSLPDDLKKPLILSTYQDLSHVEIGQVLSCSPKAVENRLYRARQRLRASLQGFLD